MIESPALAPLCDDNNVPLTGLDRRGEGINQYSSSQSHIGIPSPRSGSRMTRIILTLEDTETASSVLNVEVRSVARETTDRPRYDEVVGSCAPPHHIVRVLVGNVLWCEAVLAVT